MSELTPREIVAELDKHIVGQAEAKRSVAIALRNRWRRQQLDEPMRSEVTPKNILMIGPTGVGKTEIARRLAQMTGAPFIKVEATKFTEVGYVGRDVESIVRDLAEAAFKMLHEQRLEEVQVRAGEEAERRVIDALLQQEMGAQAQGAETMRQRRKELTQQLRSGQLDDKEIDIDAQNKLNVDIVAPHGMEDMAQQLQGLFSNITNLQPRQKLQTNVRTALQKLRQEEAARRVNQEELKNEAVQLAENNGIVFLDELDKITRRADLRSIGPEVSREGVQRDLLPLIEGSTVKTRYGMVRTDHVLFIASGAFHLSKPSDLIPELQGRLPIRVELDPLSPEDFERILVEPDSSLTEQYKALLATEGLHIDFSKGAVSAIARSAWQINESTENIGARRLHTVMEYLLEEASFDAADLAIGGKTLEIDAETVEKRLAEALQSEDLSRFIL